MVNRLFNAVSHIDQLEGALEWALDYIADGADPDENEVPKHQCEYVSDPEKGACSFCTDYWRARALLDERKP